MLMSEYHTSNISAWISNEVNEFQVVIRVTKKAFGPKRLFRGIDQGSDLRINAGEDDVVDSVDVLVVNALSQGTLFPLLLTGEAEVSGRADWRFSKAFSFAYVYCPAIAS